MVDVPSATDLKTRYPEFLQVPDNLVEAFIGEASTMVDDDWLPADQRPAILSLAAHLMNMEGWPARAANPTAPILASAGREVLERSVGDVSTKFAQSGTVVDAAGLLPSLKVTPYGRRFAQLLRLNAPTFTVL